MDYWIISNGQQQGPFSLQQVREMQLLPETPVWCTGLTDWTTAAQLPELVQFLLQPQPVQPLEEPQPMPPTYLGWSIAATLLCCLLPGIAAIFCSAKVEPRWHKGDHEGARNASDWALIWIIAAVVFGIIGLPLQLAFMGLGA